ncbi:MAG: hypothetical protein QMB45_09880 [Flavobacteriales bacterium]|jgi:hypothetical protein
MNYITTITVLLFVFILSNCGNQPDLIEVQSSADLEMINEYQDKETNFKNVILSSRTSIPGVHSNLRGTRKYEVSMGLELASAIEFKRLMVDSVVIPLAALMINGEKKSGFLLGESSEYVNISAYRRIYNKDADVPQVHEPVVYESSGFRLSKGAVLEYTKEGKPYYLEIEEMKIMPKIYAP